MDRARVRLTGAPETMLGTLYGRALDARSGRPVLGDTMAARTVDRIDYDFRRIGVNRGLAAAIAARARHFDGWAAEFLARHDRATVLHLAAGLDTRFWRLSPGPGVTWYDVDHPEVVALRRHLLPPREHHRDVGASVTDREWLAAVPGDLPTLVLAEGLSMYLTPEQGHELLRGLAARFRHGVVAFDAFNRLGIRLQQLNPVVRAAGATLHWGVDDPRELERVHPRLRRMDAVPAFEAPSSAALPWTARAVTRLFRPVPALRTMSWYLRYELRAADGTG